MLELLAPRVIAASQVRHRQLELDDAALRRSRTVLSRALRDRSLDRPAVYRALEASGIATGNSRGFHILGALALEQLICFGARAGKQPTFALLDQWVPPTQSKHREEALGELALRYFTSHGPATLQDFTWWSGLTAADGREALALARQRLACESLGGREVWYGSAARRQRVIDPTKAALLPAWDEFTVGYRDRSAVLDPAHGPLVNAGGGVLKPVMVIGGRVVGTWKRTLTKRSVVVTLEPFSRLSRGSLAAFERAAAGYGGYLGLPSEVSRRSR
jgi:hypothetical protein